MLPSRGHVIWCKLWCRQSRCFPLACRVWNPPFSESCSRRRLTVRAVVSCGEDNSGPVTGTGLAPSYLTPLARRWLICFCISLSLSRSTQDNVLIRLVYLIEHTGREILPGVMFVSRESDFMWVKHLTHSRYKGNHWWCPPCVIARQSGEFNWQVNLRCLKKVILSYQDHNSNCKVKK